MDHIGTAEKPAMLACDDQRGLLQCHRGQPRYAGVVWTVVDCEGTLQQLKTAAEANRLSFIFAGQECDLGERGKATLKELLKRAGRQ